MAHRPGSFSKNFAWGGTGLRKLHSAIRRGFKGQPSPVSRDRWSQDSEIGDSNLVLIPLNFFLHNSIINGENHVSVDELVLQALNGDHSANFDRLALFALNLSRAGRRKGSNAGQGSPMGWANEFVRERLWREGAWHTDALANPSIDPFLEDRLDARPAVRTKVRNNYRHLFELCGYLRFVRNTTRIEADPTSWGVSAVYLKWDRLTLDGELSPTADIETLTNQALHADLHKLLGTTKSEARQIVKVAAPLYIDAGRLGRIAHTPHQLRRITARLQGDARPQYGDAAERAERRAILSRIAAIERDLEELRPRMGHNNPPPDDPLPETQDAVRTIKKELEKEQPDAAVVAEKTSFLAGVGNWLGKRFEKFADKFAETMGSAAAYATIGLGSFALWSLSNQIPTLVTMLTRWLSVLF